MRLPKVLNYGAHYYHFLHGKKNWGIAFTPLINYSFTTWYTHNINFHWLFWGVNFYIHFFTPLERGETQKPKLETPKKNTTYRMGCQCGVCRRKNILIIPTGIMPDEHYKDMACEKCGINFIESEAALYSIPI